jgi:hypothetical protein
VFEDKLLRSFLWIKLASLKDDSTDTDDACIMQYFLTTLANFGILLALFFQNLLKSNSFDETCFL